MKTPQQLYEERLEQTNVLKKQIIDEFTLVFDKAIEDKKITNKGGFFYSTNCEVQTIFSNIEFSKEIINNEINKYDWKLEDLHVGPLLEKNTHEVVFDISALPTKMVVIK